MNLSIKHKPYKFNYFKCVGFLMFFSFFSTLYSQNEKKVEPSQSFFLKGNTVLIGNQILGAPDVNPSDINDIREMDYIDVDTDNTTFSSSSATMAFTETPRNVVYAALYWTALYPAESSNLKRVKNKIIHKAKGEREQNFNHIKLKLPSENYVDIEGDILFDTQNNSVYSHNNPYVCIADVTNILKNASTLNGSFTVANIKATTGIISGGAAAGWMLYVVYKSKAESAKYISIYNGFDKVDKEKLVLDFKGFNTKETDSIKSFISMGVIDGDVKIKTDRCLVFSKKENAFLFLKNEVRSAYNFFNSSITIPEKDMPSRNPQNTNTLGFDLLKLALPERSLQNLEHDFKVELYTKADAFYLFFTAFETEITNVDSNQLNLIKIAPDVPANTNTGITQAKDTKGLVKKIKIARVKAGYYLVTNVYSEVSNLNSWMTFLKEKGFVPNYYVNPKNNWHYAYIAYTPNLEDALLNQLKELKTQDEFKDSWIAEVNID